MSTIACGPASVGAELTLTQRDVLRTAMQAARLVRVQRGVVAVNLQRHAVSVPFPVRTIRALERSGYLQQADDGDGMVLTPLGAQVGGNR